MRWDPADEARVRVAVARRAASARAGRRALLAVARRDEAERLVAAGREKARERTLERTVAAVEAELEKARAERVT